MTATPTRDAIWRDIQTAARRFRDVDDTTDDAAIERYLFTAAGQDAYARYEQAPASVTPRRQLTEGPRLDVSAAAVFHHVNVDPKARTLVERGVMQTYDEAVERVYSEDPDLYTGYEAAVKRDRLQRTR